jgi:hypothetical protein
MYLYMPLTNNSQQIFDQFVDSLLTNEVKSLHKKWDFELAQSLYAIFENYCKLVGEFEVYHLYMQELEPIFFKLPATKKWQAFSLMLEHQTNGGVANEFNKYFLENFSKVQMQKLVRTCPHQQTKIALQDYLNLLYSS